MYSGLFLEMLAQSKLNEVCRRPWHAARRRSESRPLTAR